MYNLSSEITKTTSINDQLTSQFIRDCIMLAVDGFLFQHITPNDHYYRFKKKFPSAYKLLDRYKQPTPQPQQEKQKSYSSSSANRTLLQNQNQINTTSAHNILSIQQTPNKSLNISDQQHRPPLLNKTEKTVRDKGQHQNISKNGLTVKTEKPVYSPKETQSSSNSTSRSSATKKSMTNSSSDLPQKQQQVKDPSSSTSTVHAQHQHSHVFSHLQPTAPSRLSIPSPSNERPIKNPVTIDDIKLPLEIEVRNIQERMYAHRFKCSRPNDLQLMSSKEILDEKLDMQQELIKFEDKYSKPETSEQKHIMKPLYDYYSQLKRRVEKDLAQLQQQKITRH
ncbi:unnamed protein product [Didymodactylos carnosus]|uniref:Uncharacterized protein n=1 Tax=Didymodactylos carnosus TaxID=1234261 RepID=A0A813Y7G8_9BILA|nr:unnamed protein product [Didymodactylos carnosus]CAF0880464.1 unnamed protein product [Didymodactylos carnosus]CAF3504787.1 unnamed protein product [Didymodactylos carnosus]CAF3666762.1 unnamed protein product [Didymodactylos carnosus]